jgi:cytochrome c oxidase assembly protein subunit 15
VAIDAPLADAPTAGWRRLLAPLGHLTSPKRFPLLVWVAFVALYVNFCSGAMVRVTASGLGCPDWPLCNGRPAPPLAWHAVVEFSNRVLALWVILATIAMLVSAGRSVRHSDRQAWWLALAVGGGTVAQGPLGGITVLVGLHPIAVMSHFLLAILVFTAATMLVVDVHGRRDEAVERPGWLRPATIGLAVWGFLLITSGAVVTMSGTHPGAKGVKRLWNLLDAAYWHVRIAVSFVVVIAIYLFAIARLERPGPRVPALAWVVVALTGLQIAIGEWQWRHHLTWWMVLLHVMNATALWAALIALCRSVTPRATAVALAPVPDAASVTTT